MTVPSSCSCRFSLPRFRSLAANLPRFRFLSVGATLQALTLSDLRGVIRVPVFPSDFVSESIPSSCFLSHPCAQRPRPSCHRRPICYWYSVGAYPFSSSHGFELHHRVVHLAMRHFSLTITRCGGICSLISLFRIAASSTLFAGILG